MRNHKLIRKIILVTITGIAAFTTSAAKANFITDVSGETPRNIATADAAPDSPGWRACVSSSPPQEARHGRPIGDVEEWYPRAHVPGGWDAWNDLTDSVRTQIKAMARARRTQIARAPSPAAVPGDPVDEGVWRILRNFKGDIQERHGCDYYLNVYSRDVSSYYDDDWYIVVWYGTSSEAAYGADGVRRSARDWGLQSVMMFGGDVQETADMLPNDPSPYARFQSTISAHVTHGTDIRVVLNTAMTVEPGSENELLQVGYFRTINRFTLYGAAGSERGVWFPVGLFATNFSRNDNGVPFSAFPVGIAFGGRLHWRSPDRSPRYVGLSAMLNYAVIARTEENEMDTGGAVDRSFSLSSIAFGAILDYNGYVYVGGAYGIDLRQGQPNPKMMFVVGLGPSLLQSLTARDDD